MGTSKSRDSLIGLPPSSVSATANSRARSCNSRAMRKRYLPRSAPGILPHTSSNAACAAANAASTSAAPASAMSASFSSVAGLIESKYLPVLRRDELAVDEQIVARLEIRARRFPARDRKARDRRKSARARTGGRDDRCRWRRAGKRAGRCGSGRGREGYACDPHLTTRRHESHAASGGLTGRSTMLLECVCGGRPDAEISASAGRRCCWIVCANRAPCFCP